MQTNWFKMLKYYTIITNKLFKQLIGDIFKIKIIIWYKNN